MIELEGFAIYPNKVERAKEWMAFLKKSSRSSQRDPWP
nr:hypothetical protein LRH_03968 [Lacticaseibacillus rhamnosus HN001]